ncbi:MULTISPECIES: NAD-dependent epimerase/dehydratase family protein [Acidobacteriaceae]|uniref:NAD-dependent epimerase/dehydratase family protein n=1 Tax=Acidobacteriaceae TaxID=204434 RepID=UPI00131A7321|nr:MULTISPECIES: NAD-dependent epimerase/dehydratase family protein [Acidobacteriaceae]MDW5267017.1 NAD-dependent epimerase/dehydratase family protein [Edaphobacter sp.]
MEKIALFGAAGAIGQSIADALRAKGEPYRVVGRNRERLAETFGSDPNAEIVTWDPADAASVRAAARSVDTLIYLVGVPYNHFELHPLTMRQTLDGAIAEGVKRVVLIGTVYPYGVPVTEKVSEQHPRNPPTYKGKMRKEQEDMLLAAHAAGEIEATVLRLPDFYGPGVESSLLDGMFKAVANGKTADMVGPIDTPHEFVFVPDVGAVVLALAEKPEAYGRWWNLAGAGVTTQRPMAEQAFALVGRKPKIRVVGKLGLRLIGLFQPIMKELVEVHYLQTTPVLMDDAALIALLGDVHKTSYAEGVRLSVESYKAASMKA